MGALAQQGQQQRGPQAPGQMGPPPPVGGASPQRRNYFKDNMKGDIGQSLMMMGLNMLSQGPSENPMSFGSMVGQGAKAGADHYSGVMKKNKEQTRYEKEQADKAILQRRAAQNQANAEADRKRKIAREAITQSQEDTRFGREGTVYDQTNVMFDLGLDDRGREISRQNILDERSQNVFNRQKVGWTQADEDRERLMGRQDVTQGREDLQFGQTQKEWGRSDREYNQEQYDRNLLLGDQARARTRQKAQENAMKNIDLSGMSESNQKLFGPIIQFMDPNTVGQYFNDDPETVDMMTGNIKDAMFVAKANNPEGTQAEWDKATAQMIQEGAKPPVTMINTMNSPGRKGNEEYGTQLMTTAESSKVTLGLLNQFAQAEGVNTGYFGDLIQSGATGMRQVAEILGMDDSWSMARIDAMLKTDSTGGAMKEAIGNRLALEMTNQLAGQISEKELVFAIKSMPGLLTTPEGNQALVGVLGAKAQQDIDRVKFVESVRGTNSDGTPSDQPAQLPGNIKSQVLAWDEANKLRVRDDQGNVTAYGQVLLDAGMSISNDPDWTEEDGVWVDEK